MSTTSVEIERWRQEEVGKFQSRKQRVLAERGDVLRPYYGRSAGTPLPPEVKEKLEELSREHTRIEQEILAVEHEAGRKRREPINPEDAIERLSEELERERGRRKWLSYQLYANRMEGYRAELARVERRIGEIKNEIERAELAREYAEGLKSKEEEETP